MHELLTKAKIPKASKVNSRAAKTENRREVKRCAKGLRGGKCSCCPFITTRPSEVVKEVRFTSRGETFQIKDNLD